MRPETLSPQPSKNEFAQVLLGIFENLHIPVSWLQQLFRSSDQDTPKTQATSSLADDHSTTTACIRQARSLGLPFENTVGWSLEERCQHALADLKAAEAHLPYLTAPESVWLIKIYGPDCLNELVRQDYIRVPGPKPEII